MPFLARRIGDVVTIALADCAPDEATAEALRAEGVTVGIAMVDGETRDHWGTLALELDAENAAEAATSEEGVAAGAPERYRRWAQTVLHDCLRSLQGWAPGVDEERDAERLTDELDAYSLAMLVRVAQRAVSEQLPTARQAKS